MWRNGNTTAKEAGSLVPGRTHDYLKLVGPEEITKHDAAFRTGGLIPGFKQLPRRSSRYAPLLSSMDPLQVLKCWFCLAHILSHSP